MTTNVKSRLNRNVISIVYFKKPTARINYFLINKKMTQCLHPQRKWVADER